MEEQQTTVLPPEYSGLTFEKVWAMFQETDRRIEKQSQEADKRFRETERLLKEQTRETERLLKEQTQETDRRLRENQKLLGDLGKKFGKIIEHMFIPTLIEKFNALGYVFGQAGPNVFFSDKEHNIYAEVDVFLQNGDCVLAVEVKTQANIGDVREHIERMEKLRLYFDLHEDRRKIYGAMAAAVIPGNVHDFALKQGLYVIKQSGEAVSIEEPQGKPRAW